VNVRFSRVAGAAAVTAVVEQINRVPGKGLRV